MAVKLRLTRMGAKKKPTYRIVATDSRRPRDGQYLELVGTYAPVGECKVRIDEEKALKWLNAGAQPTDTVKNLLSKKHKHNFDGYLETMSNIGYNNYYKVLNVSKHLQR